jgi:hypothetical protein
MTTLLDDLKGLDLSAIVSARASITSAVNGADLQAVLHGGVAQAALGDLGGALAELRAAFKDPASLLQPLVAGLGNLTGAIRPDQLPVGDFIEAVTRGGQVVGDITAAVRLDPAALQRLVGLSLDDVLGSTVGALQEATRTLTDEASALAHLIQVAEAGLPRDPRALVEIALGMLVPGGAGPLTQLRTGVDAILGVAGSLTIPPERVSGLVVALDAVTAAALSEDPARLSHAVENLARIRASTIATLTDELNGVAARIDGLHLDTLVAPLVAASRAIETIEGGVLDLVARLRAMVAQARDVVKELDPAIVTDAVPKVFDFLEDFVQREIAAPIDTMVERVRQWLRDLLAELPLRALRERLRGEFHAVAEAIAGADLGRYGDEVRAKLHSIRGALDATDLGAKVRTAAQDAAQKVRDALGAIDGAIKSIKTAVDAAAAEAAGILQRGADALASFKGEIDRITAAVDQLGIEEAAQSVTQALTDLREKAQALLAEAPLPEPLRPLVTQLVAQVEAIDLDKAILGPVHAATAELKLGDTLEQPIKAGLAALRDALDHLVPAQLVAAIEQEIGAALETLRAFDPATLVGKLDAHIEDAAHAITALDPSAIIGEIRKPFAALLDLLDALAPEKLLEPAFRAWDSAIGALQLPTPAAAVQRATQVVGSAGDRLRTVALAPMSQLAAGAEVVAREPTAPPSPPPGATPADVKIGDVMRVLGYLPAKLHAAVTALDQSAAGEVLSALDAIGGRLATDLGRLADVMWGLEQTVRGALDDALAPLGAAELRADVAVQAHFTAGGAEVDLALDAVYDASPARVRDALVGPLDTVIDHARAAAGQLAFAAGTELDRVAHRMAASPLAAVTGSLDALVAALDVDALAADFEALVGEALESGLGFMGGAQAALVTARTRLKALVDEYNPAAQLMKFLSVVDVLRAELDVLNPRRIAADLGEVHGVIKAALSAYDPAAFAAEVSAILGDVAAKLRALEPGQLLGDLHFLDDIKAKIDAIVPATALAGVGDALQAVGQRLAQLDPAALLAAIDEVPARIEAAFAEVVERIKQEIRALLESIKYVSGSASAQVSVGAG